MSKFSAIFQRFLKGFVATVIPVIITELAKGYDFSTSTDLKRFFASLSVPVISGLLLAIEKAVNWVGPEQPVSVEEMTNATGTETTSRS